MGVSMCNVLRPKDVPRVILGRFRRRVSHIYLSWMVTLVGWSQDYSVWSMKGFVFAASLIDMSWLAAQNHRNPLTQRHYLDLDGR